MELRKGSKIRAFTPSINLNGHIYLFGRIGSGKSVTMMGLAQYYFDVGRCKIWDLHGGDRNEGVYWTLPSNDARYWAKFHLFGKPDEPGPKQYKVHLLYPYFQSKVPKRLPKKLPHVRSSLFTVPFKDISVEDIKAMLGPLSDRDKFVWDEILAKTKKKAVFREALDIADKLKASSSTIYRRFLVPLNRENFFSDLYADTNLDLKEEANMKDEVTVLCLDFVPKEFHVFVLNYVIRSLKGLVESNQIRKRNIVMIREAAMFFRATEDSVLDDNLKVFRAQMSQYIRMGRSGLYFFLDCQSPFEVKGLVSGSEDFLIMCKMTSFRDKEELTAELRRERRMRPDQVGQLAMLNPGEAYVAESGRIVKRVQFLKPRTQFWEKKHGNFYSALWERHGGHWTRTAQTIDAIKDRIGELYVTPHAKKLQAKEEAKKRKEEEAVQKEEEAEKRRLERRKIADSWYKPKREVDFYA